MKRYLVFAFDNHYPLGALDDVKQSFDSLDDAIQYSNIRPEDHYYVWDRILDVLYSPNNNYQPIPSKR